jgi:hypothetical protein
MKASIITSEEIEPFRFTATPIIIAARPKEHIHQILSMFFNIDIYKASCLHSIDIKKIVTSKI